MHAAGLTMVNVDYRIASMDGEAVFIPKSDIDSCFCVEFVVKGNRS